MKGSPALRSRPAASRVLPALLLLLSLPGTGGARGTEDYVSQIEARHKELQRMENRKKEIQGHLQESTAEEQALLRALKAAEPLAESRPAAPETVPAPTPFPESWPLAVPESRLRFLYLNYRAALRRQGDPPDAPGAANTERVSRWLRHALAVRPALPAAPPAVLAASAPAETAAPERKAQRERQSRLLALEQDRQAYYRYLAELQTSMEAVTAQLDRLRKQQRLAQQFGAARGLLVHRGKLDPPVEGLLLQSFRQSETGKRSQKPLFRGILVQTSEQALAASVAPGKVVFAASLQGYQNLVIVDHGQDSFSVYGQLEELRVAPDEYVDQGDIVGKVARDPASRKYRTYFEIRHRGLSVDPLQWLKPRSLRDSG